MGCAHSSMTGPISSRRRSTGWSRPAAAGWRDFRLKAMRAWCCARTGTSRGSRSYPAAGRGMNRHMRGWSVKACSPPRSAATFSPRPAWMRSSRRSSPSRGRRAASSSSRTTPATGSISAWPPSAQRASGSRSRWSSSPTTWRCPTYLSRAASPGPCSSTASPASCRKRAAASKTLRLRPMPRRPRFSRSGRRGTPARCRGVQSMSGSGQMRSKSDSASTAKRAPNSRALPPRAH